jgi:DNA-binding GntR family transcriptional regulator
VPVPEHAPALQKPPLRSAIYDVLRGWIIEGTLAPGERVRDLELAASLGVSRTPVREALQQLAHERLVEMTAGRWTRIAPLDVAEAERVYPIVWSLDDLAIQLSFRRLGDDDRTALGRANERLSHALDAHDARGALAADAEFHGVFARRAENDDLTPLLAGLRSRLERLELAYFNAGVGRASIVEHERVLAAIDAGDAKEAARALKQNWKRSLGRFRESLTTREAS